MVLDLVPTAESKGYACLDREIRKDFGDPRSNDRPVFRICPPPAIQGSMANAQWPMLNAQLFEHSALGIVRWP
jgi:hypothetical protein